MAAIDIGAHMFTKLDTFFIIIFLVVSSIIIGLNVVSVVDKKLGNVSVNVPPIKIPNIYVSVCEGSKGKINVYVSDKSSHTTEKKPHNNTKNKEQETEPFIVADAQDIHNYDKLKEKTLQMSNNYDKDKIETPGADTIVDYDKDYIEDDKFSIRTTYNDRKMQDRQEQTKKSQQTYLSRADFGFEPPLMAVSCANSSIAEKWKSGKKMIQPWQISCDKPNKLTAENYYKTEYNIPVVPMEDTKVRGHNYMDYASAVHPGKIDFRILSQSTKGLSPDKKDFREIPVGPNYAFHNTPAMKMP